LACSIAAFDDLKKRKKFQTKSNAVFCFFGNDELVKSPCHGCSCSARKENFFVAALIGF
jgi:hypothetical protein